MTKGLSIVEPLASSSMRHRVSAQKLDFRHTVDQGIARALFIGTVAHFGVKSEGLLNS
jgi:hypothetical protein